MCSLKHAFHDSLFLFSEFETFVSSDELPFIASRKAFKPFPNSVMTFGNFPAPNKIKTKNKIKISSPTLPDIWFLYFLLFYGNIF